MSRSYTWRGMDLVVKLFRKIHLAFAGLLTFWLTKIRCIARTTPGCRQTGQNSTVVDKRAFVSVSQLVLSLPVVFCCIASQFVWGFTPPSNWTNEESSVVHHYVDNNRNTGSYATANDACGAAMPDPYVSGNNRFVYSNPKARIHPIYGFGCDYQIAQYESDGNGGWILIDNYPLFEQNWVYPVSDCLTGSSSTDATTCKRARPARSLCCRKGDPVDPSGGYEFQNEIDYSSQAGSVDMDLVFERVYASWKPISSIGYTGRSHLGNRWFLDKYGRYLGAHTDGSNSYLYAIRGAGDVQIFQLQGGSWVGDAYNNDTLVQLSAAQAPAVWQYTNAKDNSVELYDGDGSLLSITSRSGLVSTFQYSDTNTPTSIAPYPGLLISVTNPVGRSLNFIYDTNGLLVKMIDPAGQQYVYGYNENLGSVTSNFPLLTSVTYPDGKKRSYLYETQLFQPLLNGVVPQDTVQTLLSGSVSGQVPIEQLDYNTSDLDDRVFGERDVTPLTGIVDENGNRFATISYDVFGRAITTQHAGGAVNTRFLYVADGTTDIVDALDTTRRYTYQSVLGVQKDATVTQPCADCADTKTSSKTYDTNGNLASRTDFNGISTHYTYDLTHCYYKIKFPTRW